MRNNRSLDEKRDEFFSHQWDHTVDPFQAQFDARRPLAPEELVALVEITEALRKRRNDAFIADLLRRLAQQAEKRGNDLMAVLLQLVGSTRNKILTDLRPRALAGGFSVPSSYRGLIRDDRAWAYAGPYLAMRVRTVFTPLLDESLEGAIEALNQATYPGYIRQQRAKLQGHEAEYRLATLLAACAIPFEPVEKAENPLCRDAQVHGISFDVVVPKASEPRVCVKATVHTSNIGQYGESKDHLEVDEARIVLEREFGSRRPIVLVLIDGVGFRSNRAGLDGVLLKADEFCQFKTIWKAVVICGSAMGMRIPLELPEVERKFHRNFLHAHRYEDLVVPEGTLDPAHVVIAGDAKVQTQ
jgi:hypothetical protein